MGKSTINQKTGALLVSPYYFKILKKYFNFISELKCFYKALNSIGTDFALMEALFPGRSRANLKNKFKREEKINKVLIDKALSQPTSFNIAALKLEFGKMMIFFQSTLFG